MHITHSEIVWDSNPLKNLQHLSLTLMIYTNTTQRHTSIVETHRDHDEDIEEIGGGDEEVGIWVREVSSLCYSAPGGSKEIIP
jgi:hypothetical protein